MRQSYSINKQTPSITVNVQFYVGTIMVSNPTAVAIVVAMGRPDIPTLDSADFILPGGTIVQLSVVSSNVFTFAFVQPASLPLAGNTAQIGLYSNDEAVSAIGALSLGNLGSSLVASFDVIEGAQPTAPVAGFDRIWADTLGHLHALDVASDRQLIDTLSTNIVTPAMMAAIPFSPFTPTLTQGALITPQSAVGAYLQLGKLVLWTATFIANSAGTPGAQIILGGLPITSLARGMPGIGYWTSNLNYRLFGTWVSGTAMNFIAVDAGAGAFGGFPAITVAAGNSITAFGFYEAT